jgi:choline transport protein
MASIFPTAGGQYHWVAALAPANSRKVASWATGWISIGGQICLTASSAFAAGLQFRGLVSINNDEYVPTQWQGLLFYWAVLVYALLANLLGTSALSKMNLAAGTHVLVLHYVSALADLLRSTTHRGLRRFDCHHWGFVRKAFCCLRFHGSRKLDRLAE